MGHSPTQEESIESQAKTTSDEANPTGTIPTYVMGAMDGHGEKGGRGVEGSVWLFASMMAKVVVVNAGLL